MPLPVTPLQEAIIREWIRRLADDMSQGAPNAENLLYNAMILTPTEFEAEVESFRLDLIAELQQQLVENAAAAAAIQDRLDALGGTP